MQLIDIKHFFYILSLILFSCSKDQFNIISKIKVDSETLNILTVYDNRYDAENINWQNYENFGRNLLENSDIDSEIYFFNDIKNTPKLNSERTIIDTSYYNSCIAKYIKSNNEEFLKKYPFKYELGIYDMFMNKDSTFTISFYAIRPFELAGYQIELAPNNIFNLHSVEDENLSGKYGLGVFKNKDLILSFSYYGASIPKSESNIPSKNILCTVKAKCKDFSKIKKSRFYLDAVFSSGKGEKLMIYNIPYKFKDRY